MYCNKIDLEKLIGLDPVNRTYFEDYIRHLQLRQSKERTVHSKIWRVWAFIRFTELKDAATATRTDVEDYFLERTKSCSPYSVYGYTLELKLFIRWLTPEKEKELFKNISTKIPKSHLPVDQLITKEDVRDLVSTCNNERERAIIMLLWDSAARIGELTPLNIGHVQFDRYGAAIIVSGKTGMRRIRLIESAPYLQEWINHHPLKDNPNAPLFVTHLTYAKQPHRLSPQTIAHQLKGLARRAGVIKRVNPHAFRHARLTDLARGAPGKRALSEMELRLVAGWEKNSGMPEIYVHLSGGDVERKLLENAGFVDEEEGADEISLEPVQCPRCKTLNTATALYCTRCSMALSQEAALLIEEATAIAMASDDYKEILAMVKRECGV